MDKFIQDFLSILEDTSIEQINMDTIFRDLDEWDSMTALMLIAMFDEIYKKKISGNDIRSANTISDLYKLTL